MRSLSTLGLVSAIVAFADGGVQEPVPAVPISDADGGCCVKAHVDATGTARIAYFRSAFPAARPGTVFAVTARPGQPLGPRKALLKIGPEHLSFGEPAVAWDGRGRAVAAWRTGAAEGGASGKGVRVFAAVQRANGTWMRPQTLSARGRGARLPVLALDAAGNAIVAWQALERTGWSLHSARRTAGASRFQGRRALSRPRRCCPAPVVGVAGRHAVVAWTDRRSVTSVRLTGSLVGRRVVLARGRFDGDDLDLAIDSGGNAMLAWRRSVADDRTWRIEAVRLPAGGGAPVVARVGEELPADTGRSHFDVSPQVAFARGGEAIVAVPRSAAGALGVFAQAPGATTWLGPVAIGVADGWDVHLATSPAGEVTAAWSEAPERIWASLWATGSGFAPATAFAGPDGARLPAAAAGAGRLVAAWLTDEGALGAVHPLPQNTAVAGQP